MKGAEVDEDVGRQLCLYMHRKVALEWIQLGFWDFIRIDS